MLRPGGIPGVQVGVVGGHREPQGPGHGRQLLAYCTETDQAQPPAACLVSLGQFRPRPITGQHGGRRMVGAPAEHPQAGERVFVARGAVASGKLANRVSDHMREIREQREVMFSCQSLFGAANAAGF